MKEIYDNFYDYSSESIICKKCNGYIKREKITLEHLRSSSPVKLSKYPKCNNVFIDESSVYANIIKIKKVLECK